MSLIDLHCDTISRLMDAPKGECLAVNQLSIDVEGMESAGTLAQFFACFVNAVSFENKDVHTRGAEPISSEAWGARISGGTVHGRQVRAGAE